MTKFNLASFIRPYFGAVVLSTLLLCLGGIYSVRRMASSVYPEITFPRIAVVAKKAGLDLSGMELQVTIPIEQAVTGVSGTDNVRSKTIRGGSEIYIEFAPGTDMRQAINLTNNKISVVRSSLPADVDLTVEQMTPSVFPIISVVLTGGDSPSQLRDFGTYQLGPQVKNISDVLYCNVDGGEQREIVVEPRIEDLFAANLSAADLAEQIGKLHHLVPVGRIEEPPFAFQLIVNTQGDSAAQIENLVISSKNNQPLRVGDVADVKISHEDRTQSVGFGGKDAVVLTIFRRLGGNTTNISHELRDLLAHYRFPSNIKAKIVYDQAIFINTAVDNVRDAILIGSLFSILILLAFLRSWRATLISAMAIPVTLAITFLFLYWSGETLNLMSLGGLAVAIGLIIDDTVVVIENIARHLGRRRAGTEIDPVSAASGEITGAVVGSTLTTVLVFVPLAFIAGVYGQFFAALSWSLCIAVLVSMVVSLTVIPVIAAKFLAGSQMPEPGPIYEYLAERYERGLTVALRFPWVTLAVSVLAMFFGVLLFTGIPSTSSGKSSKPGDPPPAPLVKGLETGLMPAMDEGAFILDYFAPSGTPLKRTEEIAHSLEDILSENPDIEAYVRRSGAENGIFATATNRGDIQVMLRRADEDIISLLTKPVRPPFEEVEAELKRDGVQKIRAKYRRRPLEKIMDEITDAVKEQFSEAQLKFETIQIMADELNDLSGANRPVEVKIFGPDHSKLRSLAEATGEMMEKRGKGRGLKEVDTSVMAGNPDLMIQIDGLQAAKFGLTPADVERQLAPIYLGQIATQVRESAQRITNVRVHYPNRVRYGDGMFDPGMLRDQLILVPDAPPSSDSTVSVGYKRLTGLARAIPVSSLAEIKSVRTPDEQHRENQKPAIFITAEIDESEAGLGSVVADIKSWMKEKTANNDFPPGYSWELGGHYIQQRNAFESLAVVMVVAILLVFIMLAFQFQSVTLPLLIFLTQPLSLVSGLFALWLTNTPLNVASYMGAILLIGLDMKNGILLVEYIQQLRSEGMPLRQALLVAGRTRFRPILMTSLAAILGLFPLALGIGPGSQMQQPLAIMVIGGLTANMLFTRMVIPVGYLVLEGATTGGVGIANPSNTSETNVSRLH